MKTERIHTTCYFDTLIEVAEDCPVSTSEVPPEKAERTAARIQYDLIAGNPYAYTSDDVVFAVHVEKNRVPPAKLRVEREAFFSKGQPCLRSSPLAKRYGFGIHCDAEGKVALVPLGSKEYARLVEDEAVKKIKAMRSSRK